MLRSNRSLSLPANKQVEATRYGARLTWIEKRGHPLVAACQGRVVWKSRGDVLKLVKLFREEPHARSLRRQVLKYQFSIKEWGSRLDIGQAQDEYQGIATELALNTGQVE